jgi:ribosomal protein S12 methylthiotransferase
MKTRRNDPAKINIITLGCSKNLVDSEVLLSQLKASNKQVTHEAEQSQAGTVLINTCGFIDNAKQESIETILDFVERKKRGEIRNLYVSGCLSQRYREELVAQMPEVDGFFGTTDTDLPNILNTLGADYKKELIGEREITTDSHYAYLKVSEGCNRGCSFCAIPLMRGKHRSREIEFLVKEAKYLVNKGVKEVMLIAQDLSSYGVDVTGKKQLDELLKALSDIDGLAWIRLHYMYPSGFPEEILSTMAERDNICNYMDMPIQHISSNVLKIMRRAINRERTETLLAKIREQVPGIALRTTLLVGHPGETEQDHEELLGFLERTRLDRVGVFQYSHEENTHAHTLEDDVPAEVKQQRFDDVMILQQGISLEKNQAQVGKVMKTLIDGKQDGAFFGRTEYDSPEVDNRVILEEASALRVGDFVDVEITQGLEYDLVGRVR